jgi:hypothetical protein
MRSQVGAARADELRTAGARASLGELAELDETYTSAWYGGAGSYWM